MSGKFMPVEPFIGFCTAPKYLGEMLRKDLSLWPDVELDHRAQTTWANFRKRKRGKTTCFWIDMCPANFVWNCLPLCASIYHVKSVTAQYEVYIFLFCGLCIFCCFFSLAFAFAFAVFVFAVSAAFCSFSVLACSFCVWIFVVLGVSRSAWTGFVCKFS